MNVFIKAYHQNHDVKGSITPLSLEELIVKHQDEAMLCLSKFLGEKVVKDYLTLDLDNLHPEIEGMEDVYIRDYVQWLQVAVPVHPKGVKDARVSILFAFEENTNGDFAHFESATLMFDEEELKEEDAEVLFRHWDQLLS